MTCEQCINQLFPDNPRIKTGRYNLSGCDYCDKPYLLSEKSNSKSEWDGKQWQQIEQQRAMVLHLQNKVNELLDKKDKYLYDKIKD